MYDKSWEATNVVLKELEWRRVACHVSLRFHCLCNVLTSFGFYLSSRFGCIDLWNDNLYIYSILLHRVVVSYTPTWPHIALYITTNLVIKINCYEQLPGCKDYNSFFRLMNLHVFCGHFILVSFMSFNVYSFHLKVC